MPVPLSPSAIVAALEDPKFQESIRKMCIAEQLPNERTLQAYVWSHLLHNTVEKYHTTGPRVYYDDWAIFIELYEGEKKTYPDISFLRKAALDDPMQRLFVIELKHHFSDYSIHPDDVKLLSKDVKKVNDAHCHGAVLFTCPLEELYIDVIERLNQEAIDGTSVIVIECA